MVDHSSKNDKVRRPKVHEKLQVWVHATGVTVFNKDGGPFFGLVNLKQGDVLGLELESGYYDDLHLSPVERAVYEGVDTISSNRLQNDFRLKLTNHPQLSWRCLCEFSHATIIVAELAEDTLYDQVLRSQTILT